MQIDSHVKLSLGGEELHLLTLKKNLNFKNGNLIICLLSHWYVYQCMFLTLVSLLMTFCEPKTVPTFSLNLSKMLVDVF